MRQGLLVFYGNINLNLLVRNVYQFHVYFHVRIKLHHLRPNEDNFNKVKNSYKKVHTVAFVWFDYSVIAFDYSVNTNKIWRDCDLVQKL